MWDVATDQQVISLTGGTEPDVRSLTPEKFEGRVPPLRLTRGSGCLAGKRGSENQQVGRFSCDLAVRREVGIN